MEQRQCVLLVGGRLWCEQSSISLLTGFSPEQLVCFSAQPFNGFMTLSHKQAKSQLGHEFDAVIFDTTTSLCPDSLGISLGTIRSGGLLILWLANEAEDSLWMRRFRRILFEYTDDVVQFYQVQQGQKLPTVSIPQRGVTELNDYQMSDQLTAIEAIFKVVQGHRRRPLVLSADRGRGKSAALGIAAAKLLMEGKHTILVTAPSLAIADTVFKHAELLLTDAESSRGLIRLDNREIRFIAPDTLIESGKQADLLLVDEAAAIPATMLAKILGQYSRIVFSTTLHGYEGTGRGFSVRFKQLLDQQAPGWRAYHLDKPIRWLDDDKLEAMSFDALLLNAEPVDEALIAAATIEQCVIERVDRHALLEDESQLRQLFGLMVLAHYRTRPSDLKMLLDRDDISIYIVRYQEQIVGSSWVVDEGELTAGLAQAVYRGERRVAGHLLPQSLLAHAGLSSAGGLRYRRLIRIAIHPVLQRSGLATALITHIFGECVDDKVDLLGTSFGAETALLAFWQQTGFKAVKLGVQRDDVSGCHAVMMLRASSETGAQALATLCRRFEQQWLTLLSTQFSGLDTALVLALSSQGDLKTELLSNWDWQDVRSFARNTRTYESCQCALIQFGGAVFNTGDFIRLSSQQQQLLLMLLIQQHTLAIIVNELGYSGKGQLIAALRQAIGILISTLEHGS